MIFTFKKWEAFCRGLKHNRIVSIPAAEVSPELEKYVVLKHDVETDVPKAFTLASIEHRFGHRGSYYVQAYLLQDEKNVELLRQMQQMGHEVSYHYDVMDSSHGDLENAIAEFEENKKRFEECGFCLKTVCQHGNPVVERVGYTSNRDFFRSEQVQALYPDLADIMVDYKEKYRTDYTYYSDAGRRFSTIYDPINNDRENSDDKNIPFEDLDAVLTAIVAGGSAILSTHPHRWTKSAFVYVLKSTAFKVIKAVAKLLLHIPGMKKLMGKYYYLAKKI